MKTIQDVRDATFEDLCNKLEEHGLCMVVRPTGFGKTYMTSKLMSMYKKVLFLYPTNIIADVVKGIYGEDKDNVVYMSYAGLVSKGSLMLGNYDLIICDECHRVGADKTNSVLNSYLSSNRKCKLVGLTATPQRTDDYDVLSELFNGVQTFSYTLHDAISDGFIAKPWYCYMSYGYKEDIDRSLDKGLKCIDTTVDETIKKEISSEYFADSCKIFGRDEIIRDVCNKYVKSKRYMKFMWFYPTQKYLLTQYEEIVRDFRRAFPGYRVRSTIVMSSYEYKNNVELLDKLDEQDKLIDIIFSVDMLNMGYHVDNVTGVGLCRATDSSIIFLQQIGRCINTTDVDEEPKIIFDFVDNLSRSAVYETGENALMKTDTSCVAESNCLLEGDFRAVGNLANYKQFLRKIELEPKNIMCKRAYWKFRQFGGGIDRPDVPIEFFATLYGVNVEDILEVMNISDIYDKVDESTRVSDEILNETGVY